ncbi:MAG: lysophospholipid acyltransferase family protein [Candidatus Paceibacterota bacterium]
MKRFLEKLKFLAAIYAAMFLLGPPLLWLRLRGKIRIHGLEKLWHHKRGMLIISNHPSLFETVLLPFLFFPRCILQPFKYIPWNTPDRENIMKHWYFRIFRHARMILIDRNTENTSQNVLVLRKIIKIIQDEKGTVILFPEGGRTYKRKTKVFSPRGREIGKFSESVKFISKHVERPIIIPIWVEGAEFALAPGRFIPNFNCGPVDIYIGDSIHYVSSTEELEQAVLRASEELADILYNES